MPTTEGKSMKIRKKTVIIIAVTTITMVSIVYAISQTILLNSFARLEEQNTRQNVERVLSALDKEFSELNSKCGDWAEWDDTYVYVNDLNSNFEQANLVEASFVNIRINFILFVNSTGQLVSCMGFDLKNMTETPIPESVSQMVLTNDIIWRHQEINSNITGMVLLPESPMMIASRPILTSQREGPIHGALIFARYFGTEEVELLAQTVHLPITMYRFWDSQAPSDFGTAISSLSANSPIFVNPLNADSVAGYSLIDDVFGQPILVLRADMVRDIYKQGQNTVNYLVLSLLAASIVFSISIMLLLEKVILSRLSHLTAGVTNIGAGKAASTRVAIEGDDELAMLAGSINSMLAEIENKTLKLQKSERFAVIGELATMVAHDLRNPLQGIENAAFYLKKKMSLQANERQREMLELIDENVKYSDKIVSDLLDYSREIQLQLAETNPQSLVKEAFSMVQGLGNIKVLIETRNEPTIKVDLLGMKRVFVNLVKNAIDAMPDGGTLMIRSEESNGNVEFTVSDTGIGIPKENFSKLFTPLFTTKPKGMGFGLPICKRTIEAHGGKISFESTPGKGTIFTVVIPKEPRTEGGEKGWTNQPESLLLTTTKA